MRTWTFLDSWNTLDSYYTLPHPEHSEWDSIFFGILYKERGKSDKYYELHYLMEHKLQLAT